MSAATAFQRGWQLVCALVQVVAQRPLPRQPSQDSEATTLLDERQLRDAGLYAHSDAELRDLGLAVRRPPAIDTPFRARRSVL